MRVTSNVKGRKGSPKVTQTKERTVPDQEVSVEELAEMLERLGTSSSSIERDYRKALKQLNSSLFWADWPTHANASDTRSVAKK
jgi:hypothetical protein